MVARPLKNEPPFFSGFPPLYDTILYINRKLINGPLYSNPEGFHRGNCRFQSTVLSGPDGTDSTDSDIIAISLLLGKLQQSECVSATASPCHGWLI